LKINIVTDSACDVPQTYLDRYQIRVIPAYLNFGVTDSYPDDGKSISREDFFHRLATTNPPPTSSAPPPGIAEQILRAALADADHVIAIHIPQTLSGFFNSTRVAAQAIGGNRVTVFDSGTLSMGAGWQAIMAAEAASAGESLEAILKLLDAARGRVKLWAGIDSLDYLRRSGRANVLLASLGEILQIKPIIEVSKGIVASAARVRTFKNVPKTLARLYESQVPVVRLAVLNLNQPALAEELRHDLEAIFMPEQVLFQEASLAISVNLGPSALGIATIPKNF
jgi:DegV family protein with EDD domain